MTHLPQFPFKATAVAYPYLGTFTVSGYTDFGSYRVSVDSGQYTGDYILPGNTKLSAVWYQRVIFDAEDFIEL